MALYYRYTAVVLAGLAACAPVSPTVEESREVLWENFAQRPLDELLLTWGPPAAETRLTTGGRMVTYRYGATYDAYSPYERSYGCEAVFLAPSPSYRISDVSMEGDRYACARLARGEVGYSHNVHIPTPAYYPHIQPRAGYFIGGR